MPETQAFAFLHLPYHLLIALDHRPFHFDLQPFHHLVRIAHILASAAFFGGVGLLDLRLVGWNRAVPLRALAQHVFPWLYVSFAIAAASGLALFFYDPVHVGSHAYFAPKLILIAFGLTSIALYRRTRFGAAITAPAAMPLSAKIAGAVSLTIWTAVVICSSLNVEAAPKVLLR
jgi:hypothetical protein